MLLVDVPNRIRVGGIVLHDEALLVMFRRREGREYYTFPGGGVEEHESLEDALLRELREETSVEVKLGMVRYELHRPEDTSLRNRREYFFVCTYVHGEPMLAQNSIEEKINDPQNNFFQPRWMSVADIRGGVVPLFPKEIAGRLFHDIEHGFQKAPVIVEADTPS